MADALKARAEALAQKVESAARHPLLPAEAKQAFAELAALTVEICHRLDHTLPYVDEE